MSKKLKFSVSTYAHKAFRGAKNYSRINESIMVELSSIDIPAPVSAEKVIGVYRNGPDFIVISDEAIIYLDNGNWITIFYESVVDVTWGKFLEIPEEKAINVRLANNELKTLLIEGYDIHEFGSKTYDSYLFGPFIENVCASIA